MRSWLFCLILTVFHCALYAQDPFPPYEPLYKDDVVSRIDITLPPDSLALLLAPGNEEKDWHFHCTFKFDNGEISETFEDAGLQLRGNTSRYADKKSYQVSLNEFVQGRKWYGVEKFNLNGEHNDPTVSRSKVSWDLLREIGIPAPRSSHAEVYINGEYYGLYANVEHIDEEFVQTRFGNNDGNLYKCLWPADMAYLGSDPDLYKLMSGDRRVYELKTNEEEDDYSDLAHFIDVLNNTPVQDLRCELEKVFNVHAFLKCIAFDILSGNWDGPLYNKNNFFLYHNEETGLFEYIPYDLDNTFGIDWFGIDWAQRHVYTWGHPTEPRPLYWKILQNYEYKNWLSSYIQRIVNEIYTQEVMFPKLDSLRDMLAPYVANDVFYTLDYGFDLDDFNKGFDEELPYDHTPRGIKEFIAIRRAASLSQIVVYATPPVFTYVTEKIFAGQLTILADIEDDTGINGVLILYEWNNNGLVIHGDMKDDGQHLDGFAGDGRYGITIPIPDTPSTLEYSILASDHHFDFSGYPACGQVRVVMTSLPTATLVVNEFMADNESTIADDHDDYEDWVEIFNYGPEPVYLGEFYLSDKEDNPTKWQFPDTSIEAGAYLLIWADEETDEGPLHADIKLSAGGEFVGIFDSDANANVLIDGYAFGPQEPDISFGRLPNGNGPFQALHPTPAAENEAISGLVENDFISSYRVYPNPVQGILNVEVESISKELSSIVLLNIYGQVIMEHAYEETVQFDVSPLPGGLYLIGLRSGQGISVFERVIR